MPVQIENTAVLIASTKPDGEMRFMNRDQFKREIDYGVAVSLAREMLADGLIEEHEFTEIQRLYANKYLPLVQSVEGWKAQTERQKT